MKKKSLSIILSSVTAFSLVFSLLSSDTYALEDTASAEFISEDDESDELFTDENREKESAEVSEEESADTSEKDSEKASEEDSAVPSDTDNEFFADPEDAAESDGENDPRIPVFDDSFGILLPPPGEVPENDEYVLAEEPEDDLMTAPGKANVTHYTVSMAPQKSTNRNITGIYFSDTPAIVTFFDPVGNLNVAFPSAGKKVTVQVYLLPSMTLSATKTLSMPLSLFGGITCDDDGNYYVTSGQTGAENDVTMCITKYNSDGAYQAELALKGQETVPDIWEGRVDCGTKIPFNAGNCSMCTNGGIVAVNYAREMFSKHQSNMIIYADCDSMERVYATTAYTSHSFDQRIYPYEDGFIALNHGDAYYRGFHFTKIKDFYYYDSYWNTIDDFYNFHFREGANRDFGYNETFAQLGGLAAIDNSYVFAGSSERTLSLSPGPTSGYCGHNEPRDLFIQLIKKNSESYGDENNTRDKYTVEGTTRTPTGTKPASSLTNLFLTGNEKDYGIIWLTNYSGNTYAANPKVFAISGSTFGVMWEKRTYGSASGETFFMMLDEYGNVIKEAMKVEGCLLAADTDPAVKDGLVYWATSDSYGKKIHVLDPSGIAITKQPYIISAEENGDHTKKVIIGLEAEGAETYEWQSSADGENWTAVSSSDASGYDTAELTIEKLPDNIRFYRCQMTDTDGKVAVSDAAFGFLDNAETVYAEGGANATLSVDVLGGKQYCWKYSTNGSTWNDLNDGDIIGATTRTVTIPMTDARFGYKYKCTVTGLSGNTEDSSAVNIRRKLMITKQPEDIRGAMGSTYNTGLTAFGDGLKYTWYMLDDDSGSRIPITYKGYQTATLSIKLDASTAYRSFVCVVKDKYGNELTSDKMTIRENITVSVTPKKLTLVSRPGSTAVLTVNQTGRFYP
ncbi:MAG: hypothetical protein K6F73_02790, partial [Lachnospiraceae bacterium]|nr:hypothetical protein [Lachnospiraceae bacterium]